ncbi:MAG TPA: FAD-binding oxidoreductase [Candidatus Paceibacterota bacterium]|nr:FAD-binding oxidoreductase [Candidatus Paceibacterota bacterium]
MKIIKTGGIITNCTSLTVTSKELTITLDTPIEFIAGSFVNIFMNINGITTRRAYSISSSQRDQRTISVAVRLNPEGAMSPIFWNTNVIGTRVEVMGPLGLNTADKMTHNKIYLFAFGIGAGVVKSLADYFINTKPAEEVHIITGSRTENEIVYKEYFDHLAKKNHSVSIEYVISKPQVPTTLNTGYIQDHINGLDFNNADIYTCGQEAACETLIEKIKQINPVHSNYFVEGFH